MLLSIQKHYLHNTTSLPLIQEHYTCNTGEILMSYGSLFQITGSKHMKDSEERYLLGQKHNPQIFGAIPFVKLQNDTETTVKR